MPAGSAITKREEVGRTSRVSRKRNLSLERLSIEGPTLITVRHGRMHIRWASGECVLNSGEMVALAEGQTFDMINRIDVTSGLYEAETIQLDAAIAAYFAEHLPIGKPIRDAFVVPSPRAEILACFARLYAAIGEPRRVPKSIAKIYSMELLAWLEEAGAYFGQTLEFVFTRRVRKAIASDISAPWKSSVMAERLHMSEVTLRRRLSEEGNSFSTLLMDVRMSRGLTLLQTTDLSVIQVASRTGYESPSRFTARFRKRFGYSSSDVRRRNMTL